MSHLHALELRGFVGDDLVRLADLGLDRPERGLQAAHTGGDSIHEHLEVLGVRYLLYQPAMVRHHLLAQLALEHGDACRRCDSRPTGVAVSRSSRT